MNNIRSTGRWSAILATIFAIGYSVPQLLSVFKIIPHPQDLYWLFAPSLFLAPAFLITMICLDFSVPVNLKIWTTIGWAFAAIYCTMITIVYFTQLAVVLPAQIKGDMGNKDVLLFDRRTFLMAVDCLGYFFMSLSTLFAANAFARDKKNKWLYRGLFWNGSLLPILILAFFKPSFYYAGALWMICFPVAMINAAKFFKQSGFRRDAPKTIHTDSIGYISSAGVVN
jgi:hypothetical protein